jgi:hypothetical protein
VIELYEALYSEQYAAGVPLEKQPHKKTPVASKKIMQHPKTISQKAAPAGSARKWSAPKWIALGVASLVLVGAVVFFARAAATGITTKTA